MKNFIETLLNLLTQAFEFNRENATDSEEENLEMNSDNEATEKHSENIGVPDVMLID